MLLYEFSQYNMALLFDDDDLWSQLEVLVLVVHSASNNVVPSFLCPAFAIFAPEIFILPAAAIGIVVLLLLGRLSITITVGASGNRYRYRWIGRRSWHRELRRRCAARGLRRTISKHCTIAIYRQHVIEDWIFFSAPRGSELSWRWTKEE